METFSVEQYEIVGAYVIVGLSQGESTENIIYTTKTLTQVLS